MWQDRELPLSSYERIAFTEREESFSWKAPRRKRVFTEEEDEDNVETLRQRNIGSFSFSSSRERSRSRSPRHHRKPRNRRWSRFSETLPLFSVISQSISIHHSLPSRIIDFFLLIYILDKFKKYYLTVKNQKLEMLLFQTKIN